MNQLDRFTVISVSVGFALLLFLSGCTTVCPNPDRKWNSIDREPPFGRWR